MRKTIVVKVGQPLTEETWELCEKNYHYCPNHGKCPDVLEAAYANGEVEVSMSITISPLFFCEKCGMVKYVDVFGNSHGLTEASLSPSSTKGFTARHKRKSDGVASSQSSDAKHPHASEGASK